MTLEEKLEKFKAGTYVLHAPTKEIWDKLMVELERRGYTWLSDTTMTSKDTWKCPIGVKAYTFIVGTIMHRGCFVDTLETIESLRWEFLKLPKRTSLTHRKL